VLLVAIVAADTVPDGIAGPALSVPLAWLRGAFQAIAMLAFVPIILSLLLYSESFTGCAPGILNIPRAVDTLTLMAAVAVTMSLSRSIGRTSLGHSFDALRGNETAGPRSACRWASVTGSPSSCRAPSAASSARSS
jgi:ABC-type branched-subunit amino acid transport system permease subunit